MILKKLFQKKRPPYVYCKDCLHYRRTGYKSIIKDDYCYENETDYSKVDSVMGIITGIAAGFVPEKCQEKNRYYQCRGWSYKSKFKKWTENYDWYRIYGEEEE